MIEPPLPLDEMQVIAIQAETHQRLERMRKALFFTAVTSGRYALPLRAVEPRRPLPAPRVTGKRITCPACGQWFDAPRRMLEGGRVFCPWCQRETPHPFPRWASDRIAERRPLPPRVRLEEIRHLLGPSMLERLAREVRR